MEAKTKEKIPKKVQVDNFLKRKMPITTPIEFFALVREVLFIIWDAIEPEAEKIESILLVPGSCLYRIFYPHKPGKGICSPECYMIIFEPNLTLFISDTANHVEERRYVRYVIAHEFAHFYLKHNILSKGDTEKSANNLARMWGFPVPQSTDPLDKRTVWALLDQLNEPGEKLNETYKRLLEEGVIRETEAPKNIRKINGGD